jgi:hypothetical protein
MTLKELEKRIAALELIILQGKTPEKRIQQLEGAIRWACGEVGEFSPRKEGQGAFWWRSELRRRAGM